MGNVQPNKNYNNIYDIDTDKPSAKTHKPHFYGENENYAFVNIDPEIIGRLHLTSDDSLTQEVTNDGTIVMRKIRK